MQRCIVPCRCCAWPRRIARKPRSRLLCCRGTGPSLVRQKASGTDRMFVRFGTYPVNAGWCRLFSPIALRQVFRAWVPGMDAGITAMATQMREKGWLALTVAQQGYSCQLHAIDCHAFDAFPTRPSNPAPFHRRARSDPEKMTAHTSAFAMLRSRHDIRCFQTTRMGTQAASRCG